MVSAYQCKDNLYIKTNWIVWKRPVSAYPIPVHISTNPIWQRPSHTINCLSPSSGMLGGLTTLSISSNKLQNVLGETEPPPRRVAMGCRLSCHCVPPTGRRAVWDEISQIPGVIVLAKYGGADLARNRSPSTFGGCGDLQITGMVVPGIQPAEVQCEYTLFEWNHVPPY